MLSGLNQTTKGIIVALSGFVSFSFADSCAKWLGQHYEVLDVIFVTYSLSLLLGLVFSPFLGGVQKTLATKKIFIHVGRGVFALAIAMFVVTAMKDISLAAMYTILFLAPFLTTIAAIPVYKERVPLKSWGIIALGFVGILIAFRPGVEDISWSMIYCLCALLCIVVLGLLARPLNEDESLHSLSFYPSLVTITTLAYFVLPIDIPAVEHWPVFIMNGLFVTIGLSGIAYGYRVAPYALVSPLHYSQMIVALVIGYFVFQDIPDFWMLCGASVIMFSGVLLALEKKA